MQNLGLLEPDCTIAKINKKCYIKDYESIWIRLKFMDFVKRYKPK